VSRADMKTFASPASTIFDTNSEGARYAIAINLLAWVRWDLWTR
jgi:hypothetical protein